MPPKIHPAKEIILKYMDEWRNRSGLNFRQVVARIHTQYNAEGEQTLRDKLTSRIERRPVLTSELVVAIAHAFTQGLTENERCTAAEMLEYAKAASFSFDRLDELAQFFPLAEFRAAVQPYLSNLLADAPHTLKRESIAFVVDFQPDVKIFRQDALLNVNYRTELYRDDKLMTFPDAFALFFCMKQQLLYRVPSGRTVEVSCSGNPDLVYQLEPASSEPNDNGLSDAAQHLWQATELWAQEKHGPAIDQLQSLLSQVDPPSSSLYQLLGEWQLQRAGLANSINNLSAAQTAFEQAQRLAPDPLTEAHARWGLIAVAQRQGRLDEVQAQLHAIREPSYERLTAQLLDWLQPQPTWSSASLTEFAQQLTAWFADQLHLSDAFRWQLWSPTWNVCPPTSSSGPI